MSLNIDKKALIIVDMQNDFLEGGSLEIKDSLGIIEKINTLHNLNSFDMVILTADWHPENHISFQVNNPGSTLFKPFFLEETQEYQVMWPAHCIQNSEGAQFHKDLIVKNSDVIIKKGTLRHVESYSAFGRGEEDSGLLTKLREANIQTVYVCGLALDYCVGSTAIDSQKNGFKTNVIIDCTKSTEIESEKKMLKLLDENSVKLIVSDKI